MDPELQQKPLVDAFGLVLRPIAAFETKFSGFFRVISSSTCFSAGQGDVKAPNNNRGMTCQTDQKEFNCLLEHSQRRDNLVKSN